MRSQAAIDQMQGITLETKPIEAGKPCPNQVFGQAGITSESQSQPIPAATQRLAQRTKIRVSRGDKNCGQRGNRSVSTSPGCVMAAQRYSRSSCCQRRAWQAPVRRPQSTTPSGQGSSRQQTPQPLQGAPSTGLPGAWAKTWTMVCVLGIEISGAPTIYPNSLLPD